MKSSALGCDIVTDEHISECDATVTAHHARREGIFQIIKVQDERADFADLPVDVTTDRDFLDIGHDESMRLRVVGIVVISIIGDDFGPVGRQYEVIDLQY